MRASRYFWYCNVCDAQNSREDGTCQFCECEGAECRRDNCDGPHPCPGVHHGETCSENPNGDGTYGPCMEAVL